jgi:DNA repair photolyase
MTNEYKSALNIRGDNLYCPLAFGLDTAWNCGWNCRTCYCRSLNHTWGTDQRVASPEAIRDTLINGLKNPNPKSALAAAIKNKKTLRFGNKSDPFSPEPAVCEATRQTLAYLKELDWSLKLETKTTMFLDQDILSLLDPGRCVITCTITSGLNRDHEAFESPLLASPEQRLAALEVMADLGFQVGIISEPFIPGWNTIQDWTNLLDAMTEHKLTRVNTYNLHLNPFVAKNLAEVPGLDIERVWAMNHDQQWAPILQEIIRLTEERGFILGCPDFVNSGRYQHQCNTCCGVDVPNPTRYNFITWKDIGLTKGEVSSQDVEETWDGVGAKEAGRKAFLGLDTDVYCFKEAGWTLVGETWRPGAVPTRFF